MLHARPLSSLVACLVLASPLLQGQTAPAAGEVKKLSLQEAITLAIRNNLQVQIAEESRNYYQGVYLQTQGAFDWTALASANVGRQDGTLTQGNAAGGLTVRSETQVKSRAFSVGVQKPFDWGGNLSVAYAPNYRSTSGQVMNGLTDSTGTVIGNRPVATAYPYTGALEATYTQSLLRGFGRKVAGSNVIVAELGAKAADHTFRSQLISIVAAADGLYWDVVYGARNLENKKQALELAQKQLRENKIRVEVGTLAPIEVTSAEAAVAQREQEIIAAEAQYLNAKDALIRALWPSTERPPVGIETTDAPTITPTTLDEKGAERMALERRVEIKAARLDLESKKTLEYAAKNRTKPQLDAFVSYNGTTDNYTGYSPVNTDLGRFHNPGYTVGLSFSMPIANRAAKGALSQAHANRRSSELGLRDQELAIVLEVRTAFRNLDASEKAVKAAEKTRIFRQQDLDSEQKKFDNGMSTNFLVLSKQNDLDTAKSAELQAQIFYAKAVTTFDKSIGNLLEARKLEIK